MLGERLKSLRLLNNLTQKEVSINLNLSEVRYGQYENNKRKPDYDVLKDIAKFYNVSTDYLLGNTNKDTDDKKIIEKDILKEILVKHNYMQEKEDLTNKEIEKIKNFIKINKDYIKNGK